MLHCLWNGAGIEIALALKGNKKVILLNDKKKFFLNYRHKTSILLIVPVKQLKLLKAV